MKKITKTKIIEIINLNVTNGVVLTIDQDNENLSELGMDSICFIQIIVSLEEEFECEIPDDKLIFSEMNTINKIYKVLKDIKSNTI